MNILSLKLSEITTHNLIDEKRLLKEEFGEKLLQFSKKVVEKIPEESLKLFYYNINGVQVESRNFRFINLLQGYETGGKYLNKKNVINISRQLNDHVLFHEFLHMASSFYDKNNDEIFSGFSQSTRSIQFNTFGKGINEGYTELLTERFIGKSDEYAYEIEKRIVKMLENIIGIEKFEKLYFEADLKGLINELTKYNDYESVIKFINDVDLVYREAKQLRKAEFSNYMGRIKSLLKDIIKFLIGSYIKKNQCTPKQLRKNQDFIEFMTNAPRELNFMNKKGCNPVKKHVEIISPTDFGQILKESINESRNLNFSDER